MDQEAGDQAKSHHHPEHSRRESARKAELLEVVKLVQGLAESASTSSRERLTGVGADLLIDTVAGLVFVAEPVKGPTVEREHDQHLRALFGRPGFPVRLDEGGHRRAVGLRRS